MSALLLLAAPLLACATAGAETEFDECFTGRTLRFDYHHVGTAGEEQICIDQLRLEGDWPGSRKQLVDATGLGKYRFSVWDVESGRLLYSRGFCSIYGEWETTGVALRGAWGAFHESQRFPEPREACRLMLEKRDARSNFVEFFSTEVEPRTRFVNQSAISSRGEVHDIEVHGAAHDHLDLLILADGYTAEQEEKFLGDVRRLSAALLETDPFRTHRERINVRAIHVPSAEPGISNPRKAVFRDAPLGLSFNAFDSDRYVLTYKNPFLREVAAQAPYDALMLICNDRKYGGGGIFNLWATCSADSSASEYVFVHEFGHSFGGLADEYYTSQVAYESFAPPDVEPWQPNVTAMLDPEQLKWKALVTPGTPIPTPWDQAAYDETSATYQEKRQAMIRARAEEAEVEALFEQVKQVTGPMLAGEQHAGKVGAFQGACYQAKGLYRPATDCIMFTRNPKEFCPVCRAALERVLGMYVE